MKRKARPRRARTTGTMPRRLALVRHGESDANVIQKRFKKGKIKDYPPRYKKTPDREFRLSGKGVKQGRDTGKWLGSEYPDGFDSYLSTNHVRGEETAATISISAGWHDSAWFVDPLLGERSRGDYSSLTPAQRRDFEERKKRDPLHATLPNGETMLWTRMRSRTLLERSAREHSGMDVIVVVHGEFMEAVFAEIAHMTSEEQARFFHSKAGDIRNCQVIEFSSEDPVSGHYVGKFRWWRSSCPSAGIYGKWRPITRQTFTPKQLKARVAKYPRIR